MMQQDTEKKPLAIASVPVQSWGELYGLEEGFRRGTIFPELDMPFYAAEPEQGEGSYSCRRTSEDGSAELMEEIGQISFLLDDLVLYLDTHPEDETALGIYQENSRRRRELKETFAKRFYPLTRDCMAVCGNFGWGDGKPPGEGGCA